MKKWLTVAILIFVVGWAAYLLIGRYRQENAPQGLSKEQIIQNLVNWEERKRGAEVYVPLTQQEIDANLKAWEERKRAIAEKAATSTKEQVEK